MNSPTSRTLTRLRSEGWTCTIVEKWNRFANVRQDAFGFGDVLCCKPGVGVMLVQACAGSGLSARRAKLYAEPRVRTWLESGGKVELWAWRKVGARGKRKLWDAIVEPVTLEGLSDVRDAIRGVGSEEEASATEPRG